MTKTDLLELITNGESSGLEFKRDDVRPEQLAKEIVALANFQGGLSCSGSKTTVPSPVSSGTTWKNG